MLRIHLLILFCVAAILSGCSDDTSESTADGGPIDGTGNGDGDGDGDISGDGGGDFVGDECGGPEPDGPIVTPEIATTATAPPMASGGTVKSGTYDLVSVEYFAPGSSCVIPRTVQDTLTIDVASANGGSATESFIYEYDDGFIERFANGYEYSIDGTVMTWNVVCPEPPSSSDQGFIANGETLVLVVGSVGACDASVWTYERR